MKYEINTERTSADNLSNYDATSGVVLVCAQNVTSLAKVYGWVSTISSKRKY
jgi:hypothetical protein